MRLVAGLRPDRWGSLSAPPHPLAAIGGGVLLLREREGKGNVFPPVYLISGYGPVMYRPIGAIGVQDAGNHFLKV